MITIIHIAIALGSLGYSIYLLFFPSAKRVSLSYGLVSATIASGTYLAIIDRSQILRVCATGLTFSIVSILLIAFSRRKLASKDL